MTLPDGETCTVEPSPVFTRPLFAVASYSGPPAFSDQLAGHFFVPIAPDGTSEEEIQKRLGSNSHGSIPTTAVHEAYPGHHWHITWSKIHAPKLRLVLGTSFFSEGWALYTERVMRERGFFTDPIQELYHLEATIFRAARIVVDTSLHMGEMDYEDAVSYMVGATALTEPTATVGGRPLLLVADPGVELPDRLPRDPAHQATAISTRNDQLGVEPGRRTGRRSARLPRQLCGSGRLPVGLAEHALMEAQHPDGNRLAARSRYAMQPQRRLRNGAQPRPAHKVASNEAKQSRA